MSRGPLRSGWKPAEHVRDSAGRKISVSRVPWIKVRYAPFVASSKTMVSAMPQRLKQLSLFDGGTCIAVTTAAVFKRKVTTKDQTVTQAM